MEPATTNLEHPMSLNDLCEAHLAPKPDPRDSFAFEVARICGELKADGWPMALDDCVDEAVALLGSDNSAAIDRAYRVGARVHRALHA